MMSELDVLIPDPKIYRVGAEELRVAPLPVKQVLRVAKFVQANFKDIEKFKLDSENLDVASLLEGEVYTRLNALLRLIIPTSEKVLTDEWCSDHLTNAHYRAIIVCAMKQNEVMELFQKARGFFATGMAQALARQTGRGQPETEPEKPKPEA